MNKNIGQFLVQHQLTESYLEEANKCYSALLASLVDHKKPLILGINGCQGSGKSTLADFLACTLTQDHKLKVVTISLDDFYLSRHKRQELAKNTHPLLATRGVPGTHDLSVAIQTLEQLLAGMPCKIPRFNKAEDDTYPVEQWQNITAAQDIIIFEGWCLGLQPQDSAHLRQPVNTLEQKEDAQGIWRNYVNDQLKAYQALFEMVDIWAMLKAPDFSVVYQWRLEQEQKAFGQAQTSGRHVMQQEEVERFIQFFQRLTEHALATFPQQADFVYTLDKERHIQAVKSEGSFAREGHQ